MSRELLGHTDDTDATDRHRFFNVSLIAHNSQLTTQRRLEDANINSRGLSSLRFYCIYIKKRLEDGERLVILNLFQDLTEYRKSEARSEMLKQVQHDVTKCVFVISKKTEGLKAPGYSISRLPDVLYSSFYVPRSLYVMLNLVQHLSAVKDNPLSYSGSR